MFRRAALLVFLVHSVNLHGCSTETGEIPPHVLSAGIEVAFEQIAKAFASSRDTGRRLEIRDLTIQKTEVSFSVFQEDAPLLELQLTNPGSGCPGRSTVQFCFHVHPLKAYDQDESEWAFLFLLNLIGELDDQEIWVAPSAPEPDVHDGTESLLRTASEGDSGKPTVPIRDVDCSEFLDDDGSGNLATIEDINFFSLPAESGVDWTVVAVVGVLLSLFLTPFLTWNRRGAGTGGLDLFRLRVVAWLFSTRLQPYILQVLLLAGSVWIIMHAWFGPMSAARNPAAVLLWSVWWPLIIVIPLLLSRSFCGICPVTLLGPRVQRFLRPGISLPHSMARFGLRPAVLFFILFGVADQVYAIEERPWIASQFLLGMMVLALVLHAVLSGRVWCNQVCPIGAVQSVLARLSVLTPGRREETGGEDRQKRRILPCSFDLAPLLSKTILN